jgi:large subunit ribosomal protein L16
MLSPKEQSFVDIIVESKRKASRGNTIVLEILVYSLRTRWIKSRQIESGRRIYRYVRRNGKLDPYFPDKPITMRAAESRMGSGKGTPDMGCSR